MVHGTPYVRKSRFRIQKDVTSGHSLFGPVAEHDRVACPASVARHSPPAIHSVLEPSSENLVSSTGRRRHCRRGWTISPHGEFKSQQLADTASKYTAADEFVKKMVHILSRVYYLAAGKKVDYLCMRNDLPWSMWKYLRSCLPQVIRNTQMIKVQDADKGAN